MNKPSSFLLIPAHPGLKGLGHLWEEFKSYDAAEDAQSEYADCGLDYDIVPVLG